ncbi:MAG: hypothetical protein IJ700_08430 [Bacteroidaceae bacterium]|nr:hypothetical protein [Bacteroidaceae bacterium]
MKKTYINPSTQMLVLNTREQLLDASAHTSGDVTDVNYGGKSEGGMDSDTKSNDWDIW